MDIKDSIIVKLLVHSYGDAEFSEVKRICKLTDDEVEHCKDVILAAMEDEIFDSEKGD